MLEERREWFVWALAVITFRRSCGGVSKACPQITLVLPPYIPCKTGFPLYCLPCPALSEKSDTETERGGCNMVYSLVGAEAASAIGASAPDIDAHVNIMKSLRPLFCGEAEDIRINREKKVCGCIAVIGRPLAANKSNLCI